MRERRSFTLPAGLAWPRWWLVASVAAHVVVFTALVESSMSWNGFFRPAPSEAASGPEQPGVSPRQLVLFIPEPAPPPAPRPRGTGEGPGRAPGTPAVVPVPLPPLPPADTGVVLARPGAGGQDSTSLSSRGSRSARGLRTVTDYTPQLGDGRMWVDPTTGEQVASRPIILDSAVAVRMRALADSIEKNPSADPNANPYISRPWTFKVGDKTYGIDSKGLHLGSFTIPTAVLAFLSMPEGNIDQARANQAYMAMRADILRAASRAENAEEFRAAVKEIRERKEKEHEEQQQQQGTSQPAQP